MKKERIDRRSFLKRLGLGASAAGLSLAGCSSPGKKILEPNGIKRKDLGEMTYRTNHNSGDKVSLLGFGCMRWPMKEAKEGNSEEINQEEVNRLVDYAIEHGVNYFDTSPAYCRGLSELATGIALKRHPRDKYLIATKLSNFAPQTWTQEESMKIYHNSFDQLQVDHIDYLLLHGVGMGSDSMDEFNKRFVENGMLDYLIKERESGKIRNLGFSFHGDVKVFDYLMEIHPKIHWDFAQIQLNYADWQNATGWNVNAEYLYDELTKRNIPAVIMEPLLGGRLASLPDHLSAKLKEKKPEDSIASWSFRYAGSFPNVLTVLSGMRFMEHLEDNLVTYSPLESLTLEEKQLLENIGEELIKYPTVPCTACEYCMPCPYGINIPAIFTHYNKCVTEGKLPRHNKDENYAQARKAFLIGYDRSVPKLRQASHCIGCSQCEPHCPQSIKILERLHAIDHFIEQVKQNKEVLS